MRGWRWWAPAVAVLLVVTVWPIARGVWLSLSRYSPTHPDDREFVGVDNYVDVLTSPTWWVAVAVSVVIVVVVVAVQLGFGLVFAGALHRVVARRPIVGALALVPFLLLAVASAVLWREAVTTGFAAAWFDLDGTGPVGSLIAVCVGEIWRGTGIVTLILFAGLARVPRSLLRAAIADGATGWQRMRRVVLPAMGPALAFAAVYRSFDAFRMLEGPLVVDETAAPVRTAPLLVWNTTFSSFEFGLGAAMSIVLLVIALVLAAVIVPLFRVRRVV